MSARKGKLLFAFRGIVSSEEFKGKVVRTAGSKTEIIILRGFFFMFDFIESDLVHI